MERLLSAPPIHYVMVRDNLLNEYGGKNLDGLDTPRVDSYFEETFAPKGLDVKPYIVVTAADAERVHKIDTANLLQGAFGEGVEGSYSADLGLSVIVRNPRLEALNGPAYTEGVIVHEGAHSTAKNAKFVLNTTLNTCTANRLGLSLPHSASSPGFLIEEGWGDYHRGDYAGRYSGGAALAGVTRALAWGGRGVEDRIVLGAGTTGTTLLPFKYLRLAENGTVSTIASSVAAFAVELLVAADPEIYTALCSARSEVSGAREVARRINALVPKLYPTLRRADYSETGFRRGLHTVINTVAGGMQRVMNVAKPSIP